MNRYQEKVPRHLLASLEKTLTRSPVTIVTGARQTGKTTLVCKLLTQKRRYLTLDDFDIAERATENPDALLDTTEPLTIDEVQRSPSLLLAIKKKVDQHPIPGQFLLTGSANLLMMKSVSESLAGRAIYKTLHPMTAAESNGLGRCGIWSQLLQAPIELSQESTNSENPNLFKHILNGGFPRAVFSPDDEARHEWLDGYIKTYLERDLQLLSSIDQLSDFRRLIRIAALRTGKVINQSEMARDTGITQPTAHRYLGLLEISHLLTKIPSYAVNHTKRLIKSPKLFLCDTALACYLAGIQSEQQLREHDLYGFLMENLILRDLLVWSETVVPKPEILFWRTTDGYEVDFVVEHAAGLLPIEVKFSQRARPSHISALTTFLDEYPHQATHGILLYNGHTVERMSDRIWAIPIALALGLTH